MIELIIIVALAVACATSLAAYFAVRADRDMCQQSTYAAELRERRIRNELRACLQDVQRLLDANAAMRARLDVAMRQQYDDNTVHGAKIP